MATNTYTAVVEKENDTYVALCPELDVASQGTTVEEAMANLKEAAELFLECADPAEVRRRLHSEFYVTRFEAVHG
jgi:predicted RNase H-like HicB family nuclease